MDKAPDAFRTISEVADYLETPAHVLRFWETRFPQVKPVKGAGGRRYYRPSDVALLSGIRRLLHTDGMTIRGVQKILRDQGVRHVAELGGEVLEAPEPLEALLPPAKPVGEVVPLRPVKRADPEAAEMPAPAEESLSGATQGGISPHDVSQPDVSLSDVSLTDVSPSDVSLSYVSQPDTSQPDVSQPDTSNPDASQPATSLSDALAAIRDDLAPPDEALDLGDPADLTEAALLDQAEPEGLALDAMPKMTEASDPAQPDDPALPYHPALSDADTDPLPAPLPAEMPADMPTGRPAAAFSSFGGFGLDLDVPRDGEGGFIAFTNGAEPAKPAAPQGFVAAEARPRRQPPVGEQPSLFDMASPDQAVHDLIEEVAEEAPHIYVEDDYEAEFAAFPMAPEPDPTAAELGAEDVDSEDLAAEDLGVEEVAAQLGAAELGADELPEDLPPDAPENFPEDFTENLPEDFPVAPPAELPEEVPDDAPEEDPAPQDDPADFAPQWDALEEGSEDTSVPEDSLDPEDSLAPEYSSAIEPQTGTQTRPKDAPPDAPHQESPPDASSQTAPRQNTTNHSIDSSVALAGVAAHLRRLTTTDPDQLFALADLQARLGLLQAQMVEAATRPRRSPGH